MIVRMRTGHHLFLTQQADLGLELQQADKRVTNEINGDQNKATRCSKSIDPGASQPAVLSTSKFLL